MKLIFSFAFRQREPENAYLPRNKRIKKAGPIASAFLGPRGIRQS
jgi:hypothetical protein